MRRLVLNFHLLIAVIAGVFMVIQGITGSIMAFEPELDRAFHPHLSYIRPGTKVLSITEISSTMSRRLAGEPIIAYEPSLSPELSSRVLLPSGIAYINQYTGEVLGIRARGQSFLGYVRALHVRLAVGAIGRNILRWSAVAAVLSVISGLYLWWPVKRMSIRLGGGCRRFWFDLHSVMGISSLVPLALLAGSGVVLGFEDQAAWLIHRVTHSAPKPLSRSARKPITALSEIDPDEAVAIAQSIMPGAVPYRVQMPQFGGLYRIEFVDRKDRIAGSRNSVALDPSNGTVVSVNRSAALSPGDWILAANEAVHTGGVLGLPTRVLASFFSMVVLIQALSGAFIWFHRNRILHRAGHSALQEASKMNKAILVVLVLTVNVMAADVTGRWSGKFRVDGGDHTVPQLLILHEAGNKLTGTGGPDETEQYPIENGKIDGDRLQFEITTGEWQFTYDLKADGTTMKGNLDLKSINDRRSASVSLTRVR